MRSHSGFFEKSRAAGLSITAEERESVLYVAEEAYDKARYSLPCDWMSKEHFMRVVRGLENSSSPGYPYCREKPTIGEWLGFDGVFYDEFQVERLWHEVQAFLNGDKDSLYRVFIKREPHKISKAKTGRWRLIICPPLYEQVAWAMVFGTGNDKEIETVGEIPSLQGMKLSGGDWKHYVRLFNTRKMRYGTDKSAWDWTCHWELIKLDLELRYRLIRGSAEVKSEWFALAQRLYEGAFYHPRLILSNGQVYEQMYPGILKSGCVNTISSNSHMQILAHILLCLRNNKPIFPLPFAVGDDLLEGDNWLTADEWATIGVVLKEIEDDYVFVGHRFPKTDRGGGPVPLYLAKHLFRFGEVASKDMEDYLDSMVRLYAHDPAVQALWREVAMRHDVNLPSEAYVKYWYDYPTMDLTPGHVMALN